jgi:hypothetical protein
MANRNKYNPRNKHTKEESEQSRAINKQHLQDPEYFSELNVAKRKMQKFENRLKALSDERINIEKQIVSYRNTLSAETIIALTVKTH